MTAVTTIGPNGLTDATFHVHAQGCKDVSQAKYRRSEKYNETAASLQDYTEQAYSDFIGENDSTWETYASEIKVFPCVTWDKADEAEAPEAVHAAAVPTNGVKAPRPESGEVRVRIGTPFQQVLLSATALPVPVKAVADKTAAAHAYKDGSRVVTLSRTEATALRKYADKSDHRSAKAVARALA